MANDADVQDIRDNVEKLNDNIEAMAKNGVKVNGNSFNRLSAIITMETKLGEVSENTQHISESLDKSGDIYDVLDKIREQAAGIKNFLGTNNQHITSAGSGATITNATNSGENLGGFSDVINKIYDEIKTFREQVLTALDVEKSISGGTVDDIADKLRAFNDAKEKVEKEKSEKDHKEKSSKEYWKKKKKEEKEEERARNRAEHKGLKDGLGTAKNIALGISQGTNFDGVVNSLTSKLSNFGPWGAAAGGIIQVFKGLFDLYAKQDKEASEYARTIGGSKFGKNQMIQVANRAVALAPAKYGINQEDIIKQAKELAETLGRSVSDLSEQSLISATILKKMGVGSETIGNFDTFGKGIQQTDEYFTKLYQSVSKRGLSFKNVSKNVNDNLKAAQSYNFANGLKGLEAMAEKSIQLKFNMQQTMSFANKVSDFEGAIKAAADLSVLGGSFASYANPMQMMYEGLNDVEALQNRMVNMFGGMATYNAEKKQMDINPWNRVRIQAAATVAGLDPNEMMSLALNQGKFNHIRSEIKANFDKDTLEYIKNLAELNSEGHGQITINGQTKLLSELTSSDAAAIKNEAQQKADANAATMGDIFVHTKSISETLDDMLKYLQTKLGMWVAKIAGVKFDGAGSRGYWMNLSNDEKRALIAKYGSRYQAKLAVGMGEETEKVNKSFERGEKYEGQGDIIREFLNSKADSWKWYESKRDNSNELYDKWKTGKLDFEFQQWAKEHHYNLEKQKNISTSSSSIKNTESTITNAQNNGYTLSNINDITSNPLEINPVVPISPEKIELSDFKVKIDGKIDLTSGDKSKTLDISKLSQTDIDKLTAMIYKQVYTEISKKIEHGYNKENYPFRGA